VTHVRDGDTIEVAGVAVRLEGVAAPERGEPGAGAASRFMRELVDGRELRCKLTGERNHDRVIGVCYLIGHNFGALIIRAGHARDCPRFSGSRYAAAKAAAARDGSEIRAAYRLPSYCRPQ
jgi:endonuclease YncB( thermonuclease family)